MRQEDVQTKLDLVLENLDKLQFLANLSREEWEADFRNVDATLHRLQTSMQALVDVAAYIVANLGLRTPTSSTDLIEVLREAGWLTDAEAATFTSMVQFRNRVVHPYHRLDLDIVYAILTTESDDLRRLCQRLLEIILSQGDE